MQEETVTSSFCIFQLAFWREQSRVVLPIGLCDSSVVADVVPLFLASNYKFSSPHSSLLKCYVHGRTANGSRAAALGGNNYFAFHPSKSRGER